MTKYISNEEAIVKSLPEHIKFLSRDESGDLWATEKRPKIVSDKKEGKEHSYLIFEQPSTLENTYSIAVFNHIFKDINKLDIMELMDE